MIDKTGDVIKFCEQKEQQNNESSKPLAWDNIPIVTFEVNQQWLFHI